MIRDPYAAYSAVAVDPANNEVVLTDENLFKIWVYDRSAKTSPNQSTEPKRIIGGLNTKIEFQCGLYIDPSNGDIYAVNNDTIDTLVVFSRKAQGDVVPDAGGLVVAHDVHFGQSAVRGRETSVQPDGFQQ
jgi:DNA-binding beta-propeller fold protein YncE